jgi:hypothetical protein
VVGKILEKNTYAYGYDAQAGEYGNLISKGIIDPTKVVRAALRGAASVAGLLITTETMVAKLPKKQSLAMPSPGVAWTSDHLKATKTQAVPGLLGELTCWGRQVDSRAISRHRRHSVPLEARDREVAAECG